MSGGAIRTIPVTNGRARIVCFAALVLGLDIATKVIALTAFKRDEIVSVAGGAIKLGLVVNTTLVAQSQRSLMTYAGVGSNARLFGGALLAQKGSVRATIDRFESDERSWQAGPGHTDADKKSSQERLATIDRVKSAFDGVVRDAEQNRASLRQRIEAFQRDYASALRGLRDKAQQHRAPEH